MNSPFACPIMTFGPLGQFIRLAKYYLGAPMIILGGYFVSFGGRFPTTSFFLFTTIAVSNYLLFGLYMFVLPSEYLPMWSIAIFAPVCYMMGAGLGYGAAKWPKIGITVIGFTIGAIFGFLCFTASH